MVPLTDVQVAFPRAGVAVVSVAEELDWSTSKEFSALLDAAVDHDELVVVDFSRALLIDSSVLNTLVSAHKRAQRRGSQLRLQLGDECAVKRIFEISGLLETLSWGSSREDVLGRPPRTSAPALTRPPSGEAAYGGRIR